MLRGEQPVQGTPRQKAVSLRLGFAGDDFGYAIDLGLPSAVRTVPLATIRRSSASVSGRPVAAAISAAGRSPRTAGEVTRSGRRVDGRHASARHVRQHDDALRRPAEHAGDADAARKHARLAFLRSLSDRRAAPARLPQIGTHTPILSHDGADLAAALQTIRQIGDTPALDAASSTPFLAHRSRSRSATGGSRSRCSSTGCCAAESRGTVRRHPALSALGGRAPDATPARTARAERARDEPASRSASCAGASHRADRRAHRRSSSSRMHPYWSTRCSKRRSATRSRLRRSSARRGAAGDDHERPALAMAAGPGAGLVMS